MFRLDLSDQEHELLKGLLTDRLGTLKQEIRRSELYQFKEDLKNEKGVLSQLWERVESCSGKVSGRNMGQYYAGPVECVAHFQLI